MDNNNKKKGYGFIPLLLVVVMTLGLVFFITGSNGKKAEEIPQSQAVQLIESGQVAKTEFDYNNGRLTLTVRDEKEPNNEKKQKDVYIKLGSADVYIENILLKIEAYNKAHPENAIEYQEKQVSQLPAILINMLPFVMMLGLGGILIFFMMRQAGGGGQAMNFAKAKMRTQTGSHQKVTFDDVAGADEEKEELQEIVDFLKNPKMFNEMGAHVPKGVLLVGPPGTGKTLLAKAVAGESGVPFFSISGSDFVEMFVGVGAARVRDMFDQAKKASPSIIFIDEIDAVGRHRGAGLGGGHDEREQTLNQLLVEMDGFAPNEGVIIIAATNRRDILDPALMRPGRFDRQVYVNYPDVKGREAILKIHTRNKPLGPDVELSTVAKGTVGFTGADLENLCNEAALLATRKQRKALTMEDFNEATIKVVAGPEKKSRVVTEKEKQLTAYHEGGHAVVTYHLPTQDPVHEVSIIPRGMAGGYTLSLPQEQRSYATKTHMEEEIVTLLSGRVAEQLVLEDISTGASNDIQRATKLAREMVTRYGFSQKLGPVLYSTEDDEVFLGKSYVQGRTYSETVAAEIDAEVKSLIDSAYAKSVALLQAHQDQLQLVAKALLEREKLDAADFDALMKNGCYADGKPVGAKEEAEVLSTQEVAAEAETDPQADITE